MTVFRKILRSAKIVREENSKLVYNNSLLIIVIKEKIEIRFDIFCIIMILKGDENLSIKWRHLRSMIISHTKVF